MSSSAMTSAGLTMATTTTPLTVITGMARCRRASGSGIRWMRSRSRSISSRLRKSSPCWTARARRRSPAVISSSSRSTSPSRPPRSRWMDSASDSRSSVMDPCSTRTSPIRLRAGASPEGGVSDRFAGAPAASTPDVVISVEWLTSFFRPGPTAVESLPTNPQIRPRTRRQSEREHDLQVPRRRHGGIRAAGTAGGRRGRFGRRATEAHGSAACGDRAQACAVRPEGIPSSRASAGRKPTRSRCSVVSCRR